VLLRLAYLGVTNALAMLRLLPISDQAKDTEILALRHQITVLQRQLGGEKIRFDRSDRAILAALLHQLPRDVLRRVRLLVRPDTCGAHKPDLASWRAALCAVNDPVAVTLPGMSVSLVYLLLRQVQMLARLARDDAAKDVELLVLRHQVAVLHRPVPTPGCSPPTAWCWRPCRDCSPAHAGRSSSSPRPRCCAGTAT
jgi:hypothetical protein